MMRPLNHKAEGPWWEMYAVSTSDKSKAMLFFRVEVRNRYHDPLALSRVRHS